MLKPGLKCVIKQMYFCVPFCGTGPVRFPRRFDALASCFLTFPGRGRAGIRPRGRRGLKQAENGPGKTEENRRRRERGRASRRRSASCLRPWQHARGTGAGLVIALFFSWYPGGARLPGTGAGDLSRGPSAGAAGRVPGRDRDKTKTAGGFSSVDGKKITGRIFLPPGPVMSQSYNMLSLV